MLIYETWLEQFFVVYSEERSFYHHLCFSFQKSMDYVQTIKNDWKIYKYGKILDTSLSILKTKKSGYANFVAWVTFGLPLDRESECAIAVCDVTYRYVVVKETVSINTIWYFLVNLLNYVCRLSVFVLSFGLDSSPHSLGSFLHHGNKMNIL